MQERLLADGTSDWYVPGISRTAEAPVPARHTLAIIEPANGTVYRLMERSPHEQAIALRARTAATQPLH